LHGHGPVVGLRKNGEEFPTEGSISKFEVAGTKLLTIALRDITERQRAEQEQHVLAEAGAVLASSLDYEKTLKQIARLVVATMPAVSVLDVVEEPAGLVRFTIAHRDPSRAEACKKLTALTLTRSTVFARRALDTRETEVFPEITDELLRANAVSA